jgi:hypothetical protein
MIQTEIPETVLETMSSMLRQRASLKIADQNSDRKCTHLWWNENDYNFLKFTSNDGVYEFVGDTEDKSPEAVFETNDYDYYGVYPCKYLGGLRLVSEFGPNMRKLIAKKIFDEDDSYAGSIRIITPGVASRIQVLTDNNNNYMIDAIIDNFNDNYTNNLSNYDYVNSKAAFWIIKNPVAFSIGTGNDYQEYFYQNPLGDDVYSDAFPSYVTDRSARDVAPTLATQKKRAAALLKGLVPRNAAARAHLVKKVRGMVAAAAPVVEAAPEAVPSSE